MDSDNPRTLAMLLLFGGSDTRRLLAQRLVKDGDAEQWSLLASTVCSQEPWLLRARCLEVLGLAAGAADQRTAEMILELLTVKARGGQ